MSIICAHRETSQADNEGWVICFRCGAAVRVAHLMRIRMMDAQIHPRLSPEAMRVWHRKVMGDGYWC